VSSEGNVFVVRLDFQLSPSIDLFDLEDGEGRVFLNHAPEVIKEKGEFVLVQSEGQFGFSLIPAAPMKAGYKRVDSIKKLVELVLEFGLCKPFVPRGYHGIVEKGLSDQLHKAYNECRFGSYVKLPDSSVVLVVSDEALDPGTFVEARRAWNNVLVVGRAEFESRQPFRHENWASFVSALMASYPQQVKGHLTPRKPPRRIQGTWAGPDLDYINRRGQASTRLLVDGQEEGSVVTVYFTRCDKNPSVPIRTGEAVEVWYAGKGNIAVIPYAGRTTQVLRPRELVRELGVQRDSLDERKLSSYDNVRVVYTS